MRIGIVGGTFDPIHHGHLVAAEEVRSSLGLDRVLFVPVGTPPHKRRPITPAADRVAMLAAAIADNPGFVVSRVEVDRPGPSYSVDTLAQLREEYGAATELFFVVGMDALSEMLSWHRPARLMELARIVAVTRPGFPSFDLARLEAAMPGAREAIQFVAVPELRISATDLRRRVATGRPIRYQVPSAVEAYIREHGLYRS
jgi:nicotinate-nucleotide adenylyltransferase